MGYSQVACLGWVFNLPASASQVGGLQVHLTHLILIEFRLQLLYYLRFVLCPKIWFIWGKFSVLMRMYILQLLYE